MVKIKRKSEAEREGWEAFKRKRAGERRKGGGMCAALGINPLKPTLFGRWGSSGEASVSKRKGAKDKQMITLTVIKSCYLPDGTEKFTDLRVTLNTGTTYSIPVSVAKVLFEKGLAVKRETTRI